MTQVKWFKTGTFSEVELTGYFCPFCGEKAVYEGCGDGDYYEGPSLFCRACSFDFTMPSRSVNKDLEFKDQ